jgi:hypothetical protein
MQRDDELKNKMFEQPQSVFDPHSYKFVKGRDLPVRI